MACGSLFGGKPKKKQIGDGIRVKGPQDEFAFPTFKFLMIGDVGVGKSSILLRYTEGSYTENFIGTIGVDYKDKYITVGTNKIQTQLWDTAGQERFRTITSSYYRGAHGMILTFDLSKPSSFQTVEKWLIEVERYGEDNVVVILAGNKSDQASTEVPDSEVEEWARNKNLTYMKTSAKDGTGINELFAKLAQEVVDGFPH